MARKRLPSLLSFLKGRVVAVKAETDGDLHIALTDATGDKPGIVVVEVPAEPRWCSIRETVFSWRQTKFPFHTSSAKKTKIDRSADHHCNGKGVLGRWPRAQASVEPEKPSSRLRCMGNSPGDEAGHSLKSLRLHVYGATAQRYESKISANNQRPEISSQRLCGPARQRCC